MTIASTTACTVQLSTFLAVNFVAATSLPAPVCSSPSFRTRTSTLKSSVGGCAALCPALGAGLGSVSFFTSPPTPPVVAGPRCCSGSVATPVDTLLEPRRSFHFAPATLPANSGSPKPLGPWLQLAAGKAGLRRSVRPPAVHVPENVLELPVPALTAQRVPAIVLPLYTGHPPSGCCRSYRGRNRDLVPSREPRSRERMPAGNLPSVRIMPPRRPCPSPISRNPDSLAPATPGPRRIDPRGCRIPPAPVDRSHIPDAPGPPLPPARSRGRWRRAGYTLLPGPPSCTDFQNTKLAHAPAVEDRFPSTPVAQSRRTHNRRTAG